MSSSAISSSLGAAASSSGAAGAADNDEKKRESARGITRNNPGPSNDKWRKGTKPTSVHLAAEVQRRDPHCNVKNQGRKKLLEILRQSDGAPRGGVSSSSGGGGGGGSGGSGGGRTGSSSKTKSQRWSKQDHLRLTNVLLFLKDAFLVRNAVKDRKAREKGESVMAFFRKAAVEFNDANNEFLLRNHADDHQTDALQLEYTGYVATGEILSAKFTEARTELTVNLTNFRKSGQGDGFMGGSSGSSSVTNDNDNNDDSDSNATASSGGDAHIDYNDEDEDEDDRRDLTKKKKLLKKHKKKERMIKQSLSVHSATFFEFCNGQLHKYYAYCVLVKSGMLESAQDMLPDNARGGSAAGSGGGGCLAGADSKRGGGKGGTGQGKKKRSKDDSISAIADSLENPPAVIIQQTETEKAFACSEAQRADTANRMANSSAIETLAARKRKLKKMIRSHTDEEGGDLDSSDAEEYVWIREKGVINREKGEKKEREREHLASNECV